MKSTSKFLTYAIVVSTVLYSCKKEEKTEVQPKATKENLVIADKYDTTNYSANTKNEQVVINQLIKLTNAAKEGRKLNAVVKESDLNSIFTDGSPSLAAVTLSEYKQLLTKNNGYFATLAQASGNAYNPDNGLHPTGGVYGGYLFDKNGLEMEQLIEKGLFGAALYNHLTKITNGNITLATADQMIKIYGASPVFTNSSSGKIALPFRDLMLANYAARRDQNDGKGMYSQIANNFKTLQAAIKAGDNYKEEQQNAIKNIKLLIEKVNFATVINYCHAVRNTLSGSNLDETKKGSALHAYGECVGFVAGWKYIPAGDKKITDAQIDEILALLNAPINQTPTSYKFVTETFTELSKMNQIIDKVQLIYGFSAQEIKEFESNWITVQGR